MRSGLIVARERNQRLSTHAAPVMHMLFEQIVNTDSMIVLTDSHAPSCNSVGDDSFLQRADKVALSPGANWAEHAKGKKAIGTALFEEVPTLVHAHEHCIHANQFLTCSAAPILDARGNMLGGLRPAKPQVQHRRATGRERFDADSNFIARPLPADSNGDHPVVHGTFFASGAPRTRWVGVR